MSYISRSDIKDKIIDNFDIEDYIAETDSEIEDLAASLGTTDTDDIENDPLHYKIKRYGIVFCLMRFCQDKMGLNNVELPEEDRYMVKYKAYRNELEELRPQITREMVEGCDSEIRDRATVSGTLYRG